MRFISHIIYWFHIGVIIFGVLMGLVLSLPVCLLIIAVHRAHMIYLNDCLLFKIQRKVQGLPRESRFLQYALARTFSTDISAKQAHQLDYMLVFASVIIAVLI